MRLRIGAPQFLIFRNTMISHTPILAELRLRWNESRDYLQPPARQSSDPVICAERLYSQIIRQAECAERWFRRHHAMSTVNQTDFWILRRSTDMPMDHRSLHWLCQWLSISLSYRQCTLTFLFCKIIEHVFLIIASRLHVQFSYEIEMMTIAFLSVAKRASDLASIESHMFSCASD